MHYNQWKKKYSCINNKMNLKNILVLNFRGNVVEKDTLFSDFKYEILDYYNHYNLKIFKDPSIIPQVIEFSIHADFINRIKYLLLNYLINNCTKYTVGNLSIEDNRFIIDFYSDLYQSYLRMYFNINENIAYKMIEFINHISLKYLKHE